jgi:hypothetical protein
MHPSMQNHGFWSRSLRLRCVTLMLGCAVALCGCQQYRVEYHKRPGFYQKAAMGDLPTQLTLDDGTVIKYSDYEAQSGMGRAGEEGRKPFLIREELPDGEIILRALLPEHVLVLTLTCLRNEEYDLMWEQVIAEHTRQEFEAADGGGKDACVAYFRKHRHDLVATLTRMVLGLSSQQVRFDRGGEGVIRCRLRPQFVGELKFKYFDVAKEGLGLKLLNMGG